MKFFNQILGRISPRWILRAAPGPSPWFLLRDGPTLRSQGELLRWVAAPNDAVAAGKVHLVGPGKAPLIVLDFYCYVRPVGNSHALIWFVRPLERRDGMVTKSEVVLTLLALDDLRAVSDPGSHYAELRERGGFVHHGGLVAEQTLSTELSPGSHEISLPKAFDVVDEILLLVHSTAGGVFGNSFDRMNLTLWVVRPATRSLEIVPQDWFNQGAFDFGYQWPARVARDPTNGRVVGQGVRLPYFELDETRRQIRRWRR